MNAGKGPIYPSRSNDWTSDEVNDVNADTLVICSPLCPERQPTRELSHVIWLSPTQSPVTSRWRPRPLGMRHSRVGGVCLAAQVVPPAQLFRSAAEKWRDRVTLSDDGKMDKGNQLAQTAECWSASDRNDTSH